MLYYTRVSVNCIKQIINWPWYLITCNKQVHVNWAYMYIFSNKTIKSLQPQQSIFLYHRFINWLGTGGSFNTVTQLHVLQQQKMKKNQQTSMFPYCNLLIHTFNVYPTLIRPLSIFFHIHVLGYLRKNFMQFLQYFYNWYCKKYILFYKFWVFLWLKRVISEYIFYTKYVHCFCKKKDWKY